jgi:hypothetical protein
MFSPSQRQRPAATNCLTEAFPGSYSRIPALHGPRTTYTVSDDIDVHAKNGEPMHCKGLPTNWFLCT